jgi:D-arabinan exo alpha-(1,3)/(1,5)-arabinofuranosidase (non-reducing end)
MSHARFIKTGLAVLALAVFVGAAGQSEKDKGFNGLGLGLGNLSRLSKAQTRSISPENFTGEKGKAAMSTDGPAMSAARDLGQGWKVSPYVRVPAGETFVMADVKGEGAIQQIWLTPAGSWRHAILRIYWDGESEPSVECPVGDFFASGWGQYAQISSLPVCVNPGSAFNCYWEMPFRKGFKMTLENIGAKPRPNEAPTTNQFTVYYQINYALTEVPADAAYFHAQFRRVNPLPYKEVYTLLDGVKGWGHYVGTYMAWGVHNNGWWGEGEIKFYIDGDSKFPTIAGTGTEDYFCGSYDFDAKAPDGSIQYHEFTTPYSGLPQVIRGDGHYQVMQRFGLYRWHIMDPIRFEKDLKVTIQALGWRTGGRYLPLQDDIASVAFWYQAEPHAKFPKLPDKDYLEII